MRDLHRALEDISQIRLQLAAGTMFRGFGPGVVATTGILSLGLAVCQAFVLAPRLREPDLVLHAWMLLAIVAGTLIGWEMFARTKRHHGGLADAMLFSAVESFLPMVAAGVSLAFIFTFISPESSWLLPGFWQLLLGIGLLTSVRFLLRAIVIAGAWYFLCGVIVIILASESKTISPWFMGIPFGVGQLLLAAILHFAYSTRDEEN